MAKSAPIAEATQGDPKVVHRVPPANASAEAKKDFEAAVAQCLQEHGLVVLEDAIPVAVIEQMLAHLHSAYDSYMRPGQARLFRNFQDDPKRAQIPVALTDVIANPVVFANPAVMAQVHRFIGEQVIIGEIGGVISHPGSQPQYSHRDSPFLFGGRADELGLPPHSLTITIPLMDVPLELGPTEYWLGSHRCPDASAVLAVAPQRTPLRAGSLLLYDGRLVHRGGANRSNVVRPIVYITYQHPWYIERPGYSDKPQIRVTPAMVNKLAPEHRKLVEWALHLNRFDTFDEFLMRWAGRFKTRVVEPLARRAGRGR